MKKFIFLIVPFFLIIQENDLKASHEQAYLAKDHSTSKTSYTDPIKTKLSEKDKTMLQHKVDSLYEIDQSIRLKHFQLDSDYNLPEHSFTKPTEMLKYQLSEKQFNSYSKTKDSIWKAMRVYDKQNTQELLSITRKYGFPSNERLGTKKAKAYMIFVHTPRMYRSEVREVIQKEHRKGRITDYKAAYILWHLGGRKGSRPKADQYGKLIEY